jgi:hypothetical protein
MFFSSRILIIPMETALCILTLIYIQLWNRMDGLILCRLCLQDYRPIIPVLRYVSSFLHVLNPIYSNKDRPVYPYLVIYPALELEGLHSIPLSLSTRLQTNYPHLEICEFFFKRLEFYLFQRRSTCVSSPCYLPNFGTREAAFDSVVFIYKTTD